MKSKIHLASLLLLTATLQLPSRGETPPPNIVVVLIDDLGWADLGCYGSTYFETPQLDRLAQRGVRFTSGYSSCPVCSPTRAALLTGRHPARLNLTDWLPGRGDRPGQALVGPSIRTELPLDEITIAEMLEPRGYSSAILGKWHLGGQGFTPSQQGFAVNLGGTVAGSPSGGYFGFKTPTLALEPGEYLTDRLTDEAIRFIRDHADRPFFLYLAHYSVHIPLQARADLLAKYRSRSPGSSLQKNPVYAAMVESVDQSVGRVVSTLDDLGLSDRTLIVFTSDNGGLNVREGPDTPATSNAPLRAGKGYLYEGGIRVPWIVAGPGIPPGRVLDEPIQSVDLLPTIAELTQTPLDPTRPLDGESMLPTLTRGEPMPSRALFWHYPHYSNQGGKPGSAIRRGPFKLIEWAEDRRVELYNLANDPGERTDLVEQQRDLVADLQAQLDAWRREVGARPALPRTSPVTRPQ